MASLSDEFIQWIAIVSSLLTVLAFIGNILQFMRKEDLKKTLRGVVKSQYNMHFNIARQCANCREENSGKANGLIRYVEIIGGVSDAARTQLLAFAKEELNYVPDYEHPSYPGQKMPDEVKVGANPFNLKSSTKTVKRTAAMKRATKSPMTNS